VLRAEERLRDVGSLGARQLPVGQRVDRCLRAGAVGKRAKELDSLAWRQLKPTVPAWETQASDTARPVDVEAHAVSADSSQLTPQYLRTSAARRTGRCGGIKPSAYSL